MFESIKLRIIKGRQLNPFATAKVLQEHEDRLNALEGVDTSSDETPLDNTPSDDPQEPSDNTPSDDPQEPSDNTPSDDPQEPSDTTPTTRDISVTVNDGADAVEGATVSIGDITGTTGSAGGCTLRGVADGSQTIEVTKTGFTDYSDTITVGADSTSFTISLSASSP